MGRDLLCKWLKVPPSPWPPDHYALVGLKPGEGSIDEIEQRVLERMENLRHYQLLHPELVTEGMNLLAQAMISLTDPDARQQYDSEKGLPAQDFDVSEEIDDEPEAETAPPVPLDRSRARKSPPPPLQPSAVTEEPLPEPIRLLELDDEEEQEEPDDVEDESLEVPLSILEEEPEWEEHDAQREERRRVYAEIVRVRRVMRVFERLQVYLKDPGKTFYRRTATVAFMNCLADLRPLLGSVRELVGEPNEPGTLIATLAKQQMVVEMFRSFLPSQRIALVEDCREAYAVLRDHYDALRDEARRLSAKGLKRRVIAPLGRYLAARPEWLFLVLGIAALAIAVVRSLPN